MSICPFLLAIFSQIQGYMLVKMPAMDFCNTMEFPIAILWDFNLQLSVYLSYNKQFVFQQIPMLLYIQINLFQGIFYLHKGYIKIWVII